jgi:hypothetical protein
MKKLVLCIAVAGMVAACNNNAGPSATANEAQDTLQEAVTDAQVNVAENAFPQLFQYLKQQDSTFSQDSFLLSGENKVEQVPPADIDDAHLQPFKKYLIYNSDSSLALDLFSYNYIANTRNGESRLEEAGPDSEAAVIDFRNHNRRRIFFGGPSYTLWDAKWTGPAELLLIGAEVHNENSIPTIWQINLKDTSIQVYSYQGEVKADMAGYQKEKRGMDF